MLRDVVNNSRITKTWIELNTIIRLYKLMLDAGYIEADSDTLFKFHDLWMNSHVYEVPFGYIRFEPYPRIGAATVHGIFDSNPFPHTNLIKNVLDLYLKDHPRIGRVECRIPAKFRGICKLASLLSVSETEDGDQKVFHYWRA